MSDWIIAIWTDVVNVVRYLFTGPFAGVITAGITYLVLDVGVRRRRERRAVLNAITAELELNVIELRRISEYQGVGVGLPNRFYFSSVVFRSLTARLGELDPLDTALLVRNYAMLDKLAHTRDDWAETLATVTSYPSDEREIIRARVTKGIEGFFSLVREAKELTEANMHALRGTGTAAMLKAVTVQTQRLQRPRKRDGGPS